ncbi:MAG: peptidase [Betaproteobacteria bacterium]|nr:MAG: peptidase [Betaproteobacteria bacterium]
MARPPKVCFDRVLPRDMMRLQPTVPDRPGQARAITPIGKSWMNGSTLHVRFMGGTAQQKKTAQEQAKWWTDHANLSFVFDDAPNAEIRIAFDEDDGAWSYIGTDAKGIPVSQPTMNLGFLDGGTAAHEFGHAIGLAHEHQNPAGGIQWNEQAVIRAMAGPPNRWTEAQTRHNILRKYTANQINGTEFDPKSIMLYFFPAEWTTNGIATSRNDVLSALDKQFVAGAKMYPKTKPGVSGTVTQLTVNARRRTAARIGTFGEEDLFRFRVVQPGRYIIDTQGPTDVYMKLFGPDSQTDLIAEDDDSGIASNARIAIDLIEGEYYVQVRHWNRASGVGDYTISVRKAR